MKSQLIKQIVESNEILVYDIKNKINSIKSLSELIERNLFLEDSLLEFLFSENESLESLSSFINEQIPFSNDKEKALDYFYNLENLINGEINYEEEENS